MLCLDGFRLKICPKGAKCCMYSFLIGHRFDLTFLKIAIFSNAKCHLFYFVFIFFDVVSFVSLLVNVVETFVIKAM